MQNPTALGGLSDRNNIQTITVPITLSGLFTLSFNGVSTNFINPESATLANDIQTALNNLSTIGGVGGSVTVTVNPGSPEVFLVTFGGTLVTANAPPLPLIASSGPSEQGVVTVSSGLTIDQIVTLSDSGLNGVGEGEFTLSFDGKTATAHHLQLRYLRPRR